MLTKITPFALFCFLLFYSTFAVAQGQPCEGTIITGTTCDEACWACDGQIDGYTNVVPDSPNPTGPSPLCGGGFVANNTQWLAFVAGTPNLTMSIAWGNCEQGNGMQS